MAGEKKPLQNDEMDEVAGGELYYYGTDKEDDRFEPYTDKMITVQCPKCGRSDMIWYMPFLGIQALEIYWCRSCGWKFSRDDMDHGGSNGEW